MSKYCWLIPGWVLLVIALAGCGNDREHGLYQDRDKPRAADKPDK